MSASTPNKKPAVPTTGRKTPNSNAAMAAAATTSSSSSPARPTSATGTASNNTTTTATNGLNRTRSTRTGTPLSARAAARKPASADAAADADAKAEMNARLEELAGKLAAAEQATVEREKQMAVVQAKLDESLKEQGMLEESVHESSERIEELENAKKESTRARRELEQIYESERAASMKEKEEAATREEEMRSALQRMKETLAQREMRAGLDDDRRPMVSRSASGRSGGGASPNPESGEMQFAPSSMQRSDSVSRNNSKLVMQKDKIIESLRMELAESQIKVVEMEHMGGGHLRELQKQMYEVKMQNARLMEENESFQLLLSEKTLNGDFLRPYNPRTASRPPSRSPEPPGDGEAQGTSLADELDSEADSEGGGESDRRLRNEVSSLKDQNKALTLYINNIISRLLQHEQFEQILDKTPDLMSGAPAPAPADKDKDLPPPPPPKDAETPSLLQRAKSVMGPKTSTGPKRPRPLSQQIGGDGGQPRGNANPETAPSVPIGPRMASGHRRANSDWPAASVVTNMYRGPSNPVGPLSPGLSSPSGRSSAFFQRVPSGSSVPTITETSVSKDIPQRDSKLPSNRNSMVMNSPNFEALDMAASETAQGFPSPPRSTTSSGDKDPKISGAVMMGSKPRPLRLVQEAKDEDAAKKSAANRGSWFGWMNKGAAAAAPAGLGIGGAPQGSGGGRSNSDSGPPSAQ